MSVEMSGTMSNAQRAAEVEDHISISGSDIHDEIIGFFYAPKRTTDDVARCSVEKAELQSFASLPGYTYLGSPYSKYSAGLDAACRDVSLVAAKLMNRGLRIFSPIAHSHTVGVSGQLDNLDWVFWKDQDQPLIDAASSLVVLMMDGWRESVGLNYEIECFIAAHKPIAYVSPEEL